MWGTAARVLEPGRVRRFAALMLGLCLLLPLGRCAQQPRGLVAAAAAREAGDSAAPAAEPRVTYRYRDAWSDFEAREPASWLALLTFLWPAPLLAWERRVRGGRAKLGLGALQLALCLASALYLQAIILFDEALQDLLNPLRRGG